MFPHRHSICCIFSVYFHVLLTPIQVMILWLCHWLPCTVICHLNPPLHSLIQPSFYLVLSLPVSYLCFLKCNLLIALITEEESITEMSLSFYAAVIFMLATMKTRRSHEFDYLFTFIILHLPHDLKVIFITKSYSFIFGFLLIQWT